MRRLILSGDTRQHGAVEASDALLAIERHSGVRPVELHNIRRQDPARGQTVDERERIKQYRQAVELAAAGKLDESFAQLDKMGAIVSCGLGEQADKLADEYLRLAEKNVSAVVVSQTWAEVHRVNEQVRDALKSKGLLGANDVTVQALEKIDLTNAQKRDKRFYPSDAVIVFNQKVRRCRAGRERQAGGHFEIGRAGRSGREVCDGLEPIARPPHGLPGARAFCRRTATACISRPIASWQPVAASPTVNWSRSNQSAPTGKSN